MIADLIVLETQFNFLLARESDVQSDFFVRQRQLEQAGDFVPPRPSLQLPQSPLGLSARRVRDKLITRVNQRSQPLQFIRAAMAFFTLGGGITAWKSIRTSRLMSLAPTRDLLSSGRSTLNSLFSTPPLRPNIDFTQQP